MPHYSQRMNDFIPYLQCWALKPDGEPLLTRTSMLLPVLFKKKPAMLKIALVDEEQRGNALMIWWQGQGAARVLAHKDQAILMERAVEKPALVDMVRLSQDDEASRILCAVANQVHAVKNALQAPPLLPLSSWFHALELAAAAQGSVLCHAAKVARDLLSHPQEETLLHGDIHHGNILHFGQRGWLAIDPKGLIGERGYDFANIFCNPDTPTATKPGRLEKQATLVANAAQLERTRLLKWILAYAGLSAAWHIEDGSDPELALNIVRIASAALTP